jgi:hypothetical protein
MNHIAEVARLKEQLARLDVILDRQCEPNNFNYAFGERMDIEHNLRNAAHWLLAVAGQFQAGDASLLGELIEYIDFLIPSGLEAVEEGDEEFEVIPDDQKLLIRAKDCLHRMLAAAKIMEGEQG